MRILLFILAVLLVGTLTNIVLYAMSDDYRFFVKKMKYGSETVSSDNILDVEEVVKIQDELDGDIDKVLDVVSKRQKGMTFLEVVESQKWDISDDEEQLPELTFYENEVLQAFQERFDITELLIQTRLFGLTREYPDNYYEYYSPELTLYIFPTKSYNDILKIFSLLEEEEGFFLNETNSFGEKSFFINTNADYENNDEIRLVFAYEKRAFWLKIKKESYNSVEDILQNLFPKQK